MKSTMKMRAMHIAQSGACAAMATVVAVAVVASGCGGGGGGSRGGTAGAATTATLPSLTPTRSADGYTWRVAGDAGSSRDLQALAGDPDALRGASGGEVRAIESSSSVLATFAGDVRRLVVGPDGLLVAVDGDAGQAGGVYTLGSPPTLAWPGDHGPCDVALVDGQPWAVLARLHGVEAVSLAPGAAPRQADDLTLGCATGAGGAPWVAGAAADGSPRLVRLDAAGPFTVALPPLADAGQTARIHALSPARLGELDTVVAAVEVRDADGASRAGLLAIVGLDGGLLGLVSLDDDAPVALAAIDGTLEVLTRDGRLLWLDAELSPIEEELPADVRVTALAVAGGALVVGIARDDGARLALVRTPVVPVVPPTPVAPIVAAAPAPAPVLALAAATGPTGPTSSAVAAAAGPPTVTRVAPAVGPTTGGTLITITGTNLSGATATVGGVALSGVTTTATTIKGKTGPHAAGKVAVVVTAPTGSLTVANGFQYVPAMTITAVAPKAGPVAGGTVVTITGTSFIDVTSVKLGGVALTGLTITATSIRGTTGARAAGLVDVTIVSRTRGTLKKVKLFTYGAYVKTISPITGSTAGGTTLTLTGLNLGATRSVTVGGVPLTSLTVTATRVTGRTGAHAAGRVDVVVNGGAQGTTTKVGGFTYAAPAGPSFATTVAPILTAKCAICHKPGGAAAFSPLTDAAGVVQLAPVRDGMSALGNTPSRFVTAGDAAQSLIVVKTQPGGSMAGNLTAAEAATLRDWVVGGANP